MTTQEFNDIHDYAAAPSGPGHFITGRCKHLGSYMERITVAQAITSPIRLLTGLRAEITYHGLEHIASGSTPLC